MANLQKIYSDLDLTFRRLPVTNDVALSYDEQAVIRSVRNLLLTGFYERPFQPDLGSNVRRMLFEPLDNITASNLEREIRQVISNFEPRVTITTLQVAPNEQQNAFGVYMEFEIINRTEPITIRFLLQRIR